MRRVFITLLTFTYANSFSQALIDKLQYGCSLKAKIELGCNSRNEPLINFRISSNFGVAGKWIYNELYPSINTEFQWYNGGLGSRSNVGNRYNTFDAIIAFTLTAGHLHDEFKGNAVWTARSIPLRYFADFAMPALQNPYNSSISIGTNLVFTSDQARSFQRLGFLNLNYGGVQLSYYNDGTPFQRILLGDGKDRYYTGGGVLSYNQGSGNFTDLKSYSIEISYHKFSGFNENSFEIANTINTSNVEYKDNYQQEFNKSLWKFNFLSNNENNSVGMALSFYNSVRFDGQHLIHWLINNSFHLVPYEFYYTIEPSIQTTINGFKTP